MNANDILALAKSGFSAQQIADMAALVVDTTPTVPTPTVPTPTVPTPTVPTPTVPELIKPDANIQKMIAELSKLTTTIQAQGILNSNQPEIKKETTVDILASIIAPPKKGDLNG